MATEEDDLDDEAIWEEICEIVASKSGAPVKRVRALLEAAG